MEESLLGQSPRSDDQAVNALLRRDEHKSAMSASSKEAELAMLLGELSMLDARSHEVWRKQLTSNATGRLLNWNAEPADADAIKSKLQREVDIARNNKRIIDNTKLLAFCGAAFWITIMPTGLAAHSVFTSMMGDVAGGIFVALAITLGYAIHAYYKQKDRDLAGNVPRTFWKSVSNAFDSYGEETLIKTELREITKPPEAKTIDADDITNKNNIANNMMYSRLGQIKALSKSHFGFWNAQLQALPADLSIEKRSAFETSMQITQYRLKNRKNAGTAAACIFLGTAVALATLNVYNSITKFVAPHTLLQANLFTLWAAAAISLPLGLYALFAKQDSEFDILNQTAAISYDNNTDAQILEKNKQLNREKLKGAATLPILATLGVVVALANFDGMAISKSASKSLIGLVNAEILVVGGIVAALAVVFSMSFSDRSICEQIDTMTKKPSTASAASR